jgi:hypothetical protein
MGMTRDDKVGELLAKAEQARAMAGSARSLEYERTLGGIAADYERLARCQLVFLETQRHLADSRRLIGDLSQMCDGAGRPAGGPYGGPSANG